VAFIVVCVFRNGTGVKFTERVACDLRAMRRIPVLR